MIRRLRWLVLGLIAIALAGPLTLAAQTPQPTATPRPPTATFPLYIVPTYTPPPTSTPVPPAPTATFPLYIVPTYTPQPTATPIPPTPRPAVVAQPTEPPPTVTPLPPTSTPTRPATAVPPTAAPATSTPMPTPRPITVPAREPRDISRFDAQDPDVVLVLGMVCFDENANGLCDLGEAPVRETRVSSVDGNALSLTDDLGQYVLRARPGAGISVIPPAGYRALTSTLPAQARVDFPLVTDRAPAATAPPALPAAAPTLNTTLGARISELLIYIVLGGLIALIILSNLRISGSMESLRKTQLAISEQTSRADLSAWRADLEQRIQREWGSVAGQQIADLLGESIRINDRMGITGVAAEPAPRFAVTDVRGRKFIFTTRVAALRELGIIGWRDRVLRVTESGSLSMAQALWDYVATHGQINIVVPRSSPWFMAVRDPSLGVFDPITALKGWLALQAVKRAVRNSAPWQPPEPPAPAAPAPPTTPRAGQTAPAEIEVHPPRPHERPKPIVERPAPRNPPVNPAALTEEVLPISVDPPRGA